MSLEGQRGASPESVGAVPLSDKISYVVGTTPSVLTRPKGTQVLYVTAEKGVWRMRVGDKASSMPPDPYPSASVSDGTGGFLLRSVGEQNQGIPIQAPNKLTVKGYSADAVLSYYWL